MTVIPTAEVVPIEESDPELARLLGRYFRAYPVLDDHFGAEIAVDEKGLRYKNTDVYPVIPKPKPKPAPVKKKMVAKNAKCRCGSGKKTRNCCGN